MGASLDGLIPEFQPFAHDFIRILGSSGLFPRVTSTVRSHSAQERLYRNFLAGRSRYPAAPPFTSAHEYGYAMDLVVSPYDALQDAGALWEQWGGIWGGRIGDEIHFEYPGFKSSGLGDGATVAPDQETFPGAAIVKTVAEWFSELPWYASMFIPIEWTMSSNKITREEIYARWGV